MLLVISIASGCGTSQSSAQAVNKAYCDAAKASGDFSDVLGKVDVTDLGATSANVTELVGKVRKVQSVSPDEIKGDWTAVLTTLGDVDKLLQKVKDVKLPSIANGSDNVPVDPKLLTSLEKLKNAGPALRSRAENIDIYTNKVCGFTVTGS